jgi:hypothetical protein
MLAGLPSHLLTVIRHQAIADAHPLRASDDLAWLIAPDDPALAAYQCHRREAADSGTVQAGTELDRDLACLREGWRPQPDGLTEAPTLAVDRIVISLSPEGAGVMLRGAAFGPNGSLLSRDRITSLVVAMDAAEGRWARTLNRFYRLAHLPRSDGEGEGP